MTTLTKLNQYSWLDTVWNALAAYREDCIPPTYVTDPTSGGRHLRMIDEHADEWDDICTAMAWITEELGLGDYVGD